MIDPGLSDRPGDDDLDADLAVAMGYARAAQSPATRRAYASDFRLFRIWCEKRRVPALPAVPGAVAAFAAGEAKRGIKPSTIVRRLAAIALEHRLAGHDAPTGSAMVRTTIAGIRRMAGTAPARKVPATADILRAMIAATPDSLAGLRDRALLLLGFAGAFRRSELVALGVTDIVDCYGGLRVRVRRSKGDQNGEGRVIGIVPGAVVCPVAAISAWIGAAGIVNGPLFRPVAKGGRLINARLSDKSVADIVKRYASRIGLDPEDFAGHSLRSGFLTSAAARGATIFKMRDVSRHKSIVMLSEYVRDAELFRDHAGANLL